MIPDVELDARLKQAVEAIAHADALLIGAGAGMGVDSGLPDFRGNQGFWTAYPPFQGRSFSEISNPYWFRRDPELAWGFFGHRFNLYRQKQPHAGFAILRRWGERLPLGYFVFTSNVDGHFQRAGFLEQRVIECHGSIHYLQCANRCVDVIWPAENVQVDVDENTVRALSELPRCPHCQGVARPNILMFDDWDWLQARCAEQYHHYQHWLRQVADQRVVAIELGAGLAIPTVRRECERHGDVLIRVNPREADTLTGGIGIPHGALATLKRMDALMS
ncbi:MAG: SIR2 family NAD-dependent protein deacylase [Gemmataceae bacterium]